VPMERLDGVELTWLIETSPGNYQGGLAISEPITDPVLALVRSRTRWAAGCIDYDLGRPQRTL